MPHDLKLKAEDLNGFIGTETWYRYGLIPSITYTEGVKYVADHGGAYWLIDAIIIAAAQLSARESFQVWTLKIHEFKSATLTCDDGNGTICYTRHISWTNFPLSEIKFYFTDSVLMLPSEY